MFQLDGIIPILTLLATSSEVRALSSSLPDWLLMIIMIPAVCN